MEKIIKILKAIFTLGFSVYKEYKAKQKEVDSLIHSTQEVFRYINGIRSAVKNDEKSLRDVFKEIDIRELKFVANQAQIEFGNAKEIHERIMHLYNNDVIKTIETIKN